MASTGDHHEQRAAERAPDSVEPAELVLTLHRLSRALQRLLLAQARANGPGMLEFLVLSRAAEGDGITPGEAGRSLGLNTSTMTGLSDRLEAEKLVRRHPHPTDGRLLLLKATPKGRRIRERTLGPIFAELTREAGVLAAAECATANRFLERVIVLVHEHTDALRASPPWPIEIRGARTSTPRRARRASSNTPRAHQDQRGA